MIFCKYEFVALKIFTHSKHFWESENNYERTSKFLFLCHSKIINIHTLPPYLLGSNYQIYHLLFNIQ